MHLQCGRHISGRNPCTGLHRSRRRWHPRVPRSFLEALSWRCAPPPHGFGSGGKPQILWIGRWRRLRVFLLLGGIVSEQATTGRPMDGGIFAMWVAASSPRGLWHLRRVVCRGGLFGGADFRLATKMASRGTLVAARASVVGSSRCVRGALWGTVGASPAYFPCDDRRQSRSCRLFARVAFCWHVPSWFLCSYLRVGFDDEGLR